MREHLKVLPQIVLNMFDMFLRNFVKEESKYKYLNLYLPFKAFSWVWLNLTVNLKFIWNFISDVIQSNLTNSYPTAGQRPVHSFIVVTHISQFKPIWVKFKRKLILVYVLFKLIGDIWDFKYTWFFDTNYVFVIFLFKSWAKKLQ